MQLVDPFHGHGVEQLTLERLDVVEVDLIHAQDDLADLDLPWVRMDDVTVRAVEAERGDEGLRHIVVRRDA